MTKLHQVLVAVPILLIGSTAAASAQPSRLEPAFHDPRLFSPALDPTLSESPSAQSREPAEPSFLETAAVAGFGSIVGGLVGLYLGEATQKIVGDDFEDPYLVNGAILGSWLGGWLGGAEVSKRSGRSAFGSALGVLTGGYAFHLAAQRDGGGDPRLVYGIVHGLVTAIVATSWNEIR